jgi:hypothetical protein
VTETARWHWAEGMKYALEGMKTMFILNGAAAVSILTFIGNVKSTSGLLIIAMVLFALGAATVIITMLLSYLAQLNYGNAELFPPDEAAYDGNWAKASTHHFAVYVTIAVGILTFPIGIVCAAVGLMEAHFVPPAAIQSVPYSIAIMLNPAPSIAVTKSPAVLVPSITIRLDPKSAATVAPGATR